MGRDSSVGIATGYRLKELESNSGGGARFSAPVQTGPGTHLFACTMGIRSLSLTVKRSGGGVNNPSPFSNEVTERVELYLCFPSGTM
jgi:hypothetical protein